MVGLTANPSEETLKSLRMQRASHVTRKALGVRYMRRLPISCFIIAKDEADRIGRTIESVQPWVNEVIVVDSGSTDDTMAVSDLCCPDNLHIISTILQYDPSTVANIKSQMFSKSS